MSKGKGKRRRLRNQQLARQQNKSLQSYVNKGNFGVYTGAADLEKSGGKSQKEEGMSRNMRFIMDFNKNKSSGNMNQVAEGRQREGDEEKRNAKKSGGAKGETMTSTAPEAPKKGDRAGEPTTSGTTTTTATAAAQAKALDSSGKTPQRTTTKRKGKKAREEEFVFKRDSKAKDGKLVLEQGNAFQRKKKGYLDLRREKKQEKRKRAMNPGFDEDDDLKYDNRRFFDEVAYEPPDLAMQKSKLFYSQQKQQQKERKAQKYKRR